jgi:hypothetical protein
MRVIASFFGVILALQPALGADLTYKAKPEATAPSASPCGEQGYMKVRLVEGKFHARTVSGRTLWVDEPDTVITVCADGRVFHTQVSESILPFTPEPVATLPVGELAILAGATAVAVAIIAGQEERRPISP